jgi:transcriptional regulator with XRE-family HTH domain
MVCGVQTEVMEISYKELSERAGISLSYAAQLLNGERGASLGTALKIYDRTGLQFGLLKDLPKETIEQLRPKTNQDEAA